MTRWSERDCAANNCGRSVQLLVRYRGKVEGCTRYEILRGWV